MLWLTREITCIIHILMHLLIDSSKKNLVVVDIETEQQFTLTSDQ